MADRRFRRYGTDPMMGRLVGAVLAAGILLTGCGAPGAELTQPALNATVSRSVNPDRLLNPRAIEVRSFATVEGRRTEITGARCTLRSREFRADLVTPRAVLIPALVQGARFANRGRPQPLTVRCTRGQLRGATSVEAAPIINRSSSTSTSGDFTTTTRILSGATAASKPWGFPPIRVDMN